MPQQSTTTTRAGAGGPGGWWTNQESQQAAGEEISRSSSSGRVDWSQGIQGPQPAEPAAGFDWSVGGAANLRSDLFGN